MTPTIRISTMADKEFVKWYLGNKSYDYYQPHSFTDYRIIRVLGTRYDGTSYVDYHVGFKVDGYEQWSNYLRLWMYRGEWIIAPTMYDERFRFYRLCEQTGVPIRCRYSRFENSARDYIRLTMQHNENLSNQV